MTTIRTDDGCFTGHSIESIIHREYGRGAEPLKSPDPNSPVWGQVIKAGPHGTLVLTRLISADGEYR